MSRFAPRSLSEALEGFTATLAPASTLARVQECWEAVVGSAIATAARPVGERDGVLERALRRCRVVAGARPDVG